MEFFAPSEHLPSCMGLAVTPYSLIEMKTKEVREVRSVFMYFAVKKLGMSVKESGKILKIKELAANSDARRGMIIKKEKGL